MKKTKNGQKTIFDVAKLSGFSIATASKALRGLPTVSEKTKQKVFAAADQLQYKVDKNARNLRLQRTHTIGLLLYQDPDRGNTLSNPFFMDMVSVVADALVERGYDLLLSPQQASQNWYEDFIRARRADGFIICGYDDYTEYEQRLAELMQYKVPFVDWGEVLPNQSHCTVGSNNALGGYQAVQHLIKLGRKRIVFLGTMNDHDPENQHRYQGYVNALQEAQLPIDEALQVPTISTTQSAADAIEHLVQSKIEFDAIFAMSDLVAMNAINSLRRHGLRVPDDIAVVGFDDISLASYYSPTLTTVRQHIREGGRAMVENLIAMIEGSGMRKPVSLTTELVIRESCGAKLHR